MRNYDDRRFSLPTGLQTTSGNPLHRYMRGLTHDLKKGNVGRREFVRLACLLGTTASSAMMFAGLPTRKAIAQTPVSGGTLRYGQPVQPLTNPADSQWNESANIYRQVIEFLVETDSDNITKPHLAANWYPNAELTQWTFRLRSDVRWSNGDEFNAEDVKANIERWVAPDSKSIGKTIFADLQRVEILDPLTIRITLDNPKLSLPEDIYNYPLAITHRDYAQKGGNWLEKPIGTGPFSLADYRVGEQALVRKRSGYWGPEAHLDAIRYVDLGANSAPYLSALASNQIDLMYVLSPGDIAVAKRFPNVKIQSIDTCSTALIRGKFNKPPFDNPDVREAMRLSIDREEVVRSAYSGNGSIAEDHHVSPIHPEYYALPKITRNPQKARALIEKAGYSDSNPLKLEVAVGNTQGAFESDICVIFRNNLADIGVQLDVNLMPPAQYWPIWDKVLLGTTFWVHRPLGVTALGFAYRTGAVWNEAEYSNPDFDAALSRAEGIVDPHKRSEHMKVCEEILQKDSVIIQPVWYKASTGMGKRLQNFTLHPSIYQNMRDVWLSQS